MWFKYGLKAQKLLAQGIALGYSGFYEYALKGQKLYTPPQKRKKQEPAIKLFLAFLILCCNY